MIPFVGKFAEKKRQQMTLKLVLDMATFGAIQLLGVLVRTMSWRFSRRVASLFGDFAHRVVGLRRELVYANIGLTFPEKSPAEIRTIATKVYRNVAITLFDILRFPLIRNRDDVASLIDLDPELYWRVTDNGRLGAVVVSAHYGNWELMALTCGLMVKPVTIIVKQLSNETIDRSMNKLRTMQGNSVVYDHQAIRVGLRLLADGGILALLADQSDPSATNFGEFLGRRATVFHGAAFFALKAQVPLFVVMCRSSSDGKYKIDLNQIETADLTFCKEDIATLASRYTRVIEEYICRWPEEWFWLHNRWKNGGDG
ncbi:MAG: lysophospholipid acyltransferase family protein [Chlorobium sp.]|nr:MAG: lysophospholipid acyltransferase family protein [Chlorobium sp.]